MANQNRPMSSLLGIGQVEPPVYGSARLNVGTAERIGSVAGGALLMRYGLRRGSLGGLLLATAGGLLLYRGASGFCPVNKAIGRNTANAQEPPVDSIEIANSVTVNKPREEVYQYWRKLENLPQFMEHLNEVRQLDDKKSHWIAQIADTKLAKAVGTVEWDAELIEEIENERLVWQSVPGSQLDNAGEVRFVDAPGGQGTEVHAVIQYRPPAGQLGGTIMKLFNPAFAQLIKQDLRRFKQLLETGEISTIKGQPSGRKSEHDQLEKPSSQVADVHQKHESYML